ncbi:hypothetical protein MD273_18445, partial [Marinobacter pelagius]|uniref:hypothetical protein n=1 Tax=Marinobacter sp. C7 TaxID=2951363 RepID=UPI001EF0D0F6
MKFILSDVNRYWWPVKVRMPDADNPGKFVTYELEVLFQAETQDEAIKRLEESEGVTTAREQIELQRRQLTDVVRDWRYVETEDGHAFTFNAENFRRAINKSWFRQALLRAYSESLAGEEARLGN